MTDDTGNTPQPEASNSEDTAELSLLEKLSSERRESILEVREHHGQFGLWVDAAQAYDLLLELRDHFDFDVLTDVTAVDYLNKGFRQIGGERSVEGVFVEAGG